MSESCPMFNENIFLEALININKFTNGKFESDLATCDSEMMGGVRKRGKRGKKMRGGFFNKGHVKTAIYAILAILTAISLTGEGAQVVIKGIQMIINGECGYLSNRLWFQHPLCSYWNYFVSAVGRAIMGDPAAITGLSGALIALVNAPGTVDAIVDRIAGNVSRNTPELTNGNNTPQLTNGNNNSNLLEYGGRKSKKYGRKSKKSKKSKMSKKYKMYGEKSRKSRK